MECIRGNVTQEKFNEIQDRIEYMKLMKACLGEQFQMTKDEYIKKIKELGWPDDYINEQIQMHDEAAKDRIDIPLENDLIESSIEY